MQSQIKKFTEPQYTADVIKRINGQLNQSIDETWTNNFGENQYVTVEEFRNYINTLNLNVDIENFIFLVSRNDLIFNNVLKRFYAYFLPNSTTFDLNNSMLESIPTNIVRCKGFVKNPTYLSPEANKYVLRISDNPSVEPIVLDLNGKKYPIKIINNKFKLQDFRSRDICELIKFFDPFAEPYFLKIKEPQNINIYYLWDTEMFSDFTIILENGTRKNVHKIVLYSASGYFRKSFTSFSERNKNSIEIPGDPEIISKIIDMIYYPNIFKDIEDNNEKAQILLLSLTYFELNLDYNKVVPFVDFTDIDNFAEFVVLLLNAGASIDVIASRVNEYTNIENINEDIIEQIAKSPYLAIKDYTLLTSTVIKIKKALMK
ncbi:MAG: BTB/POZ domain-containing protein [Candidatus Micrarchaeaceae archaeon]